MSNTTAATNFGSKASLYTTYAITQKAIAQTLSEMISSYMKTFEGRWLDIGCGPAILSHTLYNNHPTMKTVLFDISEKTLQQTENEGVKICGDMDSLPFIPQTFEGITSSSSFQWSRSIPDLIASLPTLLTPKGILAIAVFTETSLSELRTAQAAFDIPQPVSFPSHSNLVDMLTKNGFQIRMVNSLEFKETFSSGYDALKSISRIGAGFHEGRKFSPSTLRRFVSFFESLFCDSVTNCYTVSFFIATRE